MPQGRTYHRKYQQLSCRKDVWSRLSAKFTKKKFEKIPNTMTLRLHVFVVELSYAAKTKHMSDDLVTFRTFEPQCGPKR